MNHAEQHYLAGAMCANAGMASTAIAPLYKPRKTPRKIPGLAQSEKRGFIVSDRALVGGNLCARDMLGDLRYWLEPDEQGHCRATKQINGHFWVARSRQFWVKQLGYSEQEVKTGIKALVASGAVVKESHEFGNWDTYHYRLCFDVAGYKLRGGQKGVASNPTSPSAKQPNPVASNQGGVASNLDPVASNLATSGSTQGSTQDVKTLGAASLTPKPVPHTLGQGEAKESKDPDPKTTPNPTPGKSPWNKLGKLSADYVDQLEAVWKKGTNSHIALDDAKRGKLRNFGDKLLRADLDPLKALAALLKDSAWHNYAKRLDGTYKPYPDVMIIGTNRHINVLINLILAKRAELAANPAPQQAPGPTAISVHTPAPTKPVHVPETDLAKQHAVMAMLKSAALKTK
ncbi:hypothetical protein SAMN05443245_5872 [Paraburkholderia fungorum]|uniref:Uncharacterized protein n=1 Tax=Paraburkholderia fungorum TaxID=134537 RepID=A0A1H1IY93_9BURK|nr:hypothetical protein [Paraburkholderia fungorum]SDR42662.1 hypothetical protein SAMN05443245_5872 [Paraburkholderia fungorum]